MLENPGIRVPYQDAVSEGHENGITQLEGQLPGEGLLQSGEYHYF